MCCRRGCAEATLITTAAGVGIETARALASSPQLEGIGERPCCSMHEISRAPLGRPTSHSRRRSIAVR